MKKNGIKKFKTNLIIIVTSLILSIAFLALGFYISPESKWADFSINISASFLTVGATVILVDMLRSRHQKLTYSIPQKQALDRLTQIHTVLFLTILTNAMKKDKGFIKDFIAVGNNETNEKFPTVMSDFLIAHTKRLQDLENDKILTGYTKDEFIQLKDQLVKTQNDIEGTIRRYDFSFQDVQFNADLAEVQDKLEYVIGTFIVQSMDPNDLTKILTVKSTPQNAFEVYLAGSLKQYFEILISFLEKYKK